MPRPKLHHFPDAASCLAAVRQFVALTERVPRSADFSHRDGTNCLPQHRDWSRFFATTAALVRAAGYEPVRQRSTAAGHPWRTRRRTKGCGCTQSVRCVVARVLAAQWQETPRPGTVLADYRTHLRVAGVQPGEARWQDAVPLTP